MSRDLLTNLSLKAKLNDAIAQAAAKSTVVRIGDGQGLMLNVRPNGTASWILRSWNLGKCKDLTLGTWPTCALKDARTLAEDARHKALHGVDPAAERKAVRAIVLAERVKPESADNVRKLYEDWYANLDDRSAVYRSNIEAAFKKDVLPAIGSSAPHDIKREHITAILRGIEDRGSLVTLRRVRMWLRQMFEFGLDDEAWPLVEASPVPMGMLKSFKIAKKGRHFPAITDPAEVPELMRKLRGITDNWVIRSAFMLSVHVWQRPTEIREAVWEEFDLDGGKWVIPASRMKLASEHWVPLSRQMVQILRHYQGVVGESGLLFPGRKYGKSISEGTLTSRLITAGFDGRHSPHGFRAMGRTICQHHLKMAVQPLEKHLSHEVDTSNLGGAYVRFHPNDFWEERVAIMQQWSDWLDKQV